MNSPLLPESQNVQEASLNQTPSTGVTSAIESRRKFLFGGATLLLAGTGIVAASWKKESLEHWSNEKALTAFPDGITIGNTPLHVRTVNVPGSTQCLIVLERDRLQQRVFEPTAFPPLTADGDPDYHVSPDLAAVILELQKQYGISTVHIDDRGWAILGEDYINQIQTAVHIYTRNDVHIHEAQLANLMGNLDTARLENIIESINSQKEESQFTINYYTSRIRIMMGNDELTKNMIDGKLTFTPFIPITIKNFSKQPDHLTHPVYSSTEIAAFLESCAAESKNAVILTGQAALLEECMHSYNKQHGNKFSCAILTPQNNRDEAEGQ